MKQKIAVVDDIYANRFFLEQCLSDYIVHLFENSNGLFTYLAAEIPDLIILDIGLPGEDGISIAKRLAGAERYNDIPDIFVTAHSSKNEVMQGFKSGGYDYVIKPFDGELLPERVKSVIMRKRIERSKTDIRSSAL